MAQNSIKNDSHKINGRLFNKDEQEICEDIFGHVNIDVEEMKDFMSMKEKIRSSLYV